MCVCCLWRTEESINPTPLIWNWSYHGCEQGWESNLGPLQEKQGLSLIHLSCPGELVGFCMFVWIFCCNFCVCLLVVLFVIEDQPQSVVM